jgi:hypothetical protein
MTRSSNDVVEGVRAAAGAWLNRDLSVRHRSSQLSGNGHLTPAACAADRYSWTVLWEIEQLRAIRCWLSPREWSRRTSFNLRMVSLFCGNWESPLFSGVQSPRLPNLMPVTVPNYSRETDRHHFGIVIDISSGTLIAIPRNPHFYKEFTGTYSI